MEETPEYYENQALAFLADTCKEKDRTIKILTKSLVLSVLVNLLLCLYEML